MALVVAKPPRVVTQLPASSCVPAGQAPPAPPAPPAAPPPAPSVAASSTPPHAAAASAIPSATIRPLRATPTFISRAAPSRKHADRKWMKLLRSSPTARARRQPYDGGACTFRAPGRPAEEGAL